MPETDPPPSDPPPSTPPPPEPSDQGGRQRDEVARYKAIARQHEKAHKEAQAELQALKDAQKSDIERASEAARSWQARAEQAELRALRMEVAARKGLTDAQARRLQGSTEEELEADADELVAAFKPPAPPEGEGAGLPPADRRPQPRLRPGAVPEAGPVETDPRKLAAQIRRSF